MPRKSAGASKLMKQRRIAPETNAAVLRALDNLDAAVSRLSDVVVKIISHPCEIPQINSSEHSATLVPSEIVPPPPALEAAPPPAAAEHTRSERATQMPPAETEAPTEPEPQYGFAERLLSVRPRIQQ